MQPSEVAKLLQAAKRAVDEADLPEELQTVAFPIAVDLLNRQPAAPKEARETPAGGGPTRPATGTDPDEPAEKLAKAFEITVATIEEVFDFSEGHFALHVPTGRLTGSKRETTQQLALLCVAGRLLSGIDTASTASADIREVGAHYGNKFDSSNFAKYLKEQDDEFRIVGTGRSATVKLTRQGQENAKTLIERLVQ